MSTRRMRLWTIDRKSFAVDVPSDGTVATLAQVLMRKGYAVDAKIVYKGKILGYNTPVSDIDEESGKVVAVGRLRDDSYLPSEQEEDALESVLNEIAGGGYTPLETALLRVPNFEAMRERVRTCPSAMMRVISFLQLRHPQVVAEIERDPEGFCEALRHGLPEIDDDESPTEGAPLQTDGNPRLAVEELALSAVLLDIMSGATPLEALLQGSPLFRDLSRRVRSGALDVGSAAATLQSRDASIQNVLFHDPDQAQDLASYLSGGLPSYADEASPDETDAEQRDAGDDFADDDDDDAFVDPVLVDRVVAAVGCEPSEARLGLRATDGNVEQAVTLLLEDEDQAP
ncbi:hypothetical protein DIPPA_26873 [Diplonema papillatum]|nr:hypothetical protein DIPPA_26873 [Diplonema papillatum]